MSVVTGKVWKYGDDVNTDVIFPGKYTYTIKERADMAKVACEDLDAEFNKNAKAGDIIVGGKNWGCGSSREQAVTCIKERGIAAIIARSFARIYYRNCFNEGLAIIICPEAVDAIEAGEDVTIDFDNFVITTAKGQKISFPRLSPKRSPLKAPCPLTNRTPATSTSSAPGTENPSQRIRARSMGSSAFQYPPMVNTNSNSPTATATQMA